MSQSDAGSVEVHPDLYDALSAMIGNDYKSEGQITIQIAGGEIKDVKVNGSVRMFRHLGSKVSVRSG